MKKQFKTIMFAIIAMFTIIACETVPPGHRGVEVSWGGETNMNTVYNEGVDNGIHWLFDDMVHYDVREQTLVQKFEFNDKNNMITKVELSLDFRLDPDKVNQLHTSISDYNTKIVKTLKSAGKEVIPQYSAVELNISKRTEAENQLSSIISAELPEFYVQFARIQMTDVDIPVKVAQLAEETAVQLGKNELALNKEAEQVALAKARIAKAEGNFKAAKFDEQTKKLMSQPKLLELYKAETDRIWAEKGKSPYGSNNMFGVDAAAVMKNVKGSN